MKICSKCKQELEIIKFWKDKSSKDGYQSICKQCAKTKNTEWCKLHPRINRKEYIKQWRVNNTDKLKIFNKKRNKEFKDFLNSIKITLGCQICGEKDSICLDFHHIGSKDYNIQTKQGSYKMMLKELCKCCILCANCHRKVHGNTLNNSLITIDITPYLYLTKNGID